MELLSPEFHAKSFRNKIPKIVGINIKDVEVKGSPRLMARNCHLRLDLKLTKFVFIYCNRVLSMHGNIPEVHFKYFFYLFLLGIHMICFVSFNEKKQRDSLLLSRLANSSTVLYKETNYYVVLSLVLSLVVGTLTTPTESVMEERNRLFLVQISSTVAGIPNCLILNFSNECPSEIKQCRRTETLLVALLPNHSPITKWRGFLGDNAYKGTGWYNVSNFSFKMTSNAINSLLLGGFLDSKVFPLIISNLQAVEPAFGNGLPHKVESNNNCYLIPLLIHKMLGKAPLSANSLAILDIRLNSVSNNKAYFCSLSNHLFITIFCSST
ncbi:hypothetical protein EGR_04107 [Echinococcus granulosus]|uniref:Uncharacterized protein n=1 Tax=Echinococcus granulosus TaxID=6210 RepID=W6V4J5_ECHGR|nr:hypothetical protein EGR_04107 [Echinococcus granulosus]EUB61074.1 hypothetical protein EGR_04107 [Echinococcus granulosus]